MAKKVKKSTEKTVRKQHELFEKHPNLKILLIMFGITVTTYFIFYSMFVS